MYNNSDPYVLHCQAKQTYLICQCGKSQQPPLYDQAHCLCQPYKINNNKTKIIWLCGCHKSAEMPLCDGSHNSHKKSLWQVIKNKITGS